MEPTATRSLAKKREAQALFEFSITKLLILGVLGLMIFGPEQLPKMAAQAGKALRDLRRMAENARTDLTESLGPEFSDFDFADLNPRSFVRKHLLDDLDDEDFSWAGPSGPGVMDLDSAGAGSSGSGLGEDVGSALREAPPFDFDAT
jgi:sec-independent protein translocase protein TatB